MLQLTDPLRESLLMSFFGDTLLTPYGKFFLCPFNTLLMPYRKVLLLYYFLYCPLLILCGRIFCCPFFTPHWKSSLYVLSLLHFINHCTLLAPCRKVFFFCPLFTTLYWPLTDLYYSVLTPHRSLLLRINPSQIFTTPYWPLTDLYYSVLTPHEKIFLFPCCTTLYWSLAGKSSSSSILSLQHLIWSLAGKVSSSSVLSLWESFFLCPFFKGKSYPLSFLYGKASSSVLSLRESLLLTFFTTPYWSLAGKSSSI